MKIGFEPRETGWRGRGRPRKEVPPEIRALAERTYQTGHVGRCVIEPGEESAARELVAHLRRHARDRGLKMNVQRDGRILRWQMIDPPKASRRQ